MPQVPEDVAGFGDHVVAALRSALGEELLGVCFVGSVALGGYVPGESDVDLAAVCRHGISDGVKDAIITAVLDAAADCPARGLELTLYRQEIASSAPVGTDFEVNVNGGPRMETAVHLTTDGEAPFWYVLDRAIAHRHGIALTGPSPDELFADAPRTHLLGAMRDSMRWHRTHERATLYSVLNATRAWRFAADDVLGSKLDGARWARSRWRHPPLIDAAVDLRHGRPALLEEGDVDELLAHVEDALGEAVERGGP